MDAEWWKLEGHPSGGEVWNWTQRSEFQCRACLHSEPEGNRYLPCRKASGNGLCPGSEPPALAGSHTLSQVRSSRHRSGGPHVLLQAQSGAGGRGVMFTLCIQCGNASQAPEALPCSTKPCRTAPANTSTSLRSLTGPALEVGSSRTSPGPMSSAYLNFFCL